MLARTLLAAGLLSFAAFPAAAEFVDETLLVNVPAGYKIGFRDRDKNELVNEMVPDNETVNDWTEMVTVQIFYNLKVTPESFRASGEKFWAETCAGSAFNTVAKGIENGYPALVWMQSCPLNSQTGKPEITWFKAIQGNDSFYVVQKAFKFEPSKEQVVEWTRYLKKVAVCDTRLPERPCKQ
jgi:hypothetical protein